MLGRWRVSLGEWLGNMCPFQTEQAFRRECMGKPCLKGYFLEPFCESCPSTSTIITTQAACGESGTKGGTPSSHLGLPPLVTLRSPGEHRPWEYLSLPVTSGVCLTVQLRAHPAGRVCRLRVTTQMWGRAAQQAAEDCSGNFCFLGFFKTFFFFLSSRDAGDWAVIPLSRDHDGHCAQMTWLCWSWQRVVSAYPPAHPPGSGKETCGHAARSGRQDREKAKDGVCQESAVLKWVGNDDLKGRTASLHMQRISAKNLPKNFSSFYPGRAGQALQKGTGRQGRLLLSFVCSPHCLVRFSCVSLVFNGKF